MLTVSLVEKDVVCFCLPTVSAPDLPCSAPRSQQRSRIKSQRGSISIVKETKDNNHWQKQRPIQSQESDDLNDSSIVNLDCEYSHVNRWHGTRGVKYERQR